MIMDSSKPRKQRYFRFNAAMHLRQHFVHAHVDKELGAKLGLKRRAVQISKGDTVKVMSGSKRGTTGRVARVNLRTGRIYLDSLMKKNARGKEFGVGISANNVYSTALNLSDKIRAKKLNLKQQAEVKPAKAAAQPVAEKAAEPSEAKVQHIAENKKQEIVNALQKS